MNGDTLTKAALATSAKFNREKSNHAKFNRGETNSAKFKSLRAKHPMTRRVVRGCRNRLRTRLAAPGLTALRSCAIAPVLCLAACNFASQPAVASGTAGATGAAAAVVVETTLGPVAGRRSATVEAFLGIPYAAAPTGERRFEAPAPPEGWRAPIAADTFGAGCPQPANRLAPPQLAEDCLFLNVWRPTPATTDRKLPIMVWIHGGGFRFGSGNLPGAQFAERGVLLVSFNYRLGLLGFVAHPAIENPSSNVGVQDMVAALQWVKANAEAFGGDPENLTAFGVSAGGMGVHLLLTSPLADGLVNKAIVQSGYGTWPLPRARTAPVPAPYGLGNTPRESAELMASTAFSRISNAPQTIELLRSMPATAIAEALEGFHRPIVDGLVIPEEPALRSLEGQQQAVPLLTGGNSFEGSVLPGTGVDPQRYREGLAPYWAQLAATYAAVDATVPAQVQRIFGDERYLLAAQRLARANAALGSPTYLYYNDFRLPDRQDPRGAHHGSDALALLYGSRSKEPAVRHFAASLMERWTTFARTGAPVLAGERWPQTTAQTPFWFPLSDGASEAPSARRAGLVERIEILEQRYAKRVAPALQGRKEGLAGEGPAE